MKRLMICIAFVMCGLGAARAQFFQAVNADGVTLCYMAQRGDTTAELYRAWKDWPYYGDRKPQGRVVVPEKVSHAGRTYTVVGVGDYALYRCTGVTEVVLPPTCQYIGVQAFNGCVAMQNIVLPEGLRTLPEGAFAYCSSLRQVQLPQSVAAIGISAFAMCTGLESVTMSADAWRSCNALTFHGCTNLGEAKNCKTRPDGSVVLQK